MAATDIDGSAEPSGHAAGRPAVSMPTATAIVVADMIGVGVFTSLGFQLQGLSSGFSLLLLWLVGGVVALCGAFCYGELAAMFPRSSGEYNFLRQAYHPALGFLAGWISATVGFAAPVALAAMAFGEYGRAIFPSAPPMVLAILVVWTVSLVSLLGLRHSTAFQMTWTLLKVILIAGFLIAGFAFATPQPISFAPSVADTTQIFSASFAISLVFVMYSYSGWNAATYIVTEMRDPQRSLPRSLLAGTSIVILLYVVLNALFLYTTPLGHLSGQIDVAVIAGKHMFGDLGGRVVGAVICIGLVSSISAMMWIGPRVTLAMGKDIAALRIFGRRSERGVPTAAIVFQLAAATLMLVTQSFEAVLDLIQFSLLACSFLAVLGVIKLRITHPDLPRPYKAWGYPITPIVFLSVTAFMMYYLVTQRPVQSLCGLVIMGVGFALYYLVRPAAVSGLAKPA